MSLRDARDTITAAVETKPSDGPLIATKFHIPRLWPGRVARPSLLATLRGAARARLILVSAPPGSGKTTVLASWHADEAENRPFAWLSLERRDNDPVRFWTGVLSALRTVAPEFGPGIDAALRAPGADISELAMPLLVNALAALGDPLVLVLDDYHEIDNPDVHSSMQFLLDHLSPTTQVALATRTDPPLGLARLRARAELCELRADQLRLDEREAGVLLNEAMSLDLDPAQVRSLQEQTEGWAAGLQLVGLSLRGHPDRQEYISAFAGDDRHIVDYLAAEVLDRQTPEVRRFLLRTSILERMCGTLCDAVADADGSSRLLVSLERANLFLIPLDGRSTWYRYHHLFRDLLRHELELSERSLVPILHERALRWHVEQDVIPEAIHHATEAADYAQAAELIASNWLTYVNRGQLETVEAWTAALPAPLADNDPRLCLARAWMLLVLGRPGEVESAVLAAERGVAPGPMRDGSSSIESSAAMVRTSANLHLGDVAGARRTAALAARLEPDRGAPWRPIVTNALGMSAYWSGDNAAALAAFDETVATAERVGNHTAEIYALGYLAVIAARGGEYARADRLADEALTRARVHDLGEHWVTVKARRAAGESAIARGELEPARATIDHALELAQRGGLRLDIVSGLLGLIRIAAAAGNREGARDLHARAERQLAACPDPGMMRDRMQRAAAEARTQRATTTRPIADDLSTRELAVLRLLPSELSLREIGAELYVSFNTVKTHARNVYAKLRVGSREEAVARARELSLI
jgi:LuxR family maltose regulon positive regulatory protein